MRLTRLTEGILLQDDVLEAYANQRVLNFRELEDAGPSYGVSVTWFSFDGEDDNGDVGDFTPASFYAAFREGMLVSEYAASRGHKVFEIPVYKGDPEHDDVTAVLFCAAASRGRVLSLIGTMPYKDSVR